MYFNVCTVMYNIKQHLTASQDALYLEVDLLSLAYSEYGEFYAFVDSCESVDKTIPSYCFILNKCAIISIRN